MVLGDLVTVSFAYHYTKGLRMFFSLCPHFSFNLHLCLWEGDTESQTQSAVMLVSPIFAILKKFLKHLWIYFWLNSKRLLKYNNSDFGSLTKEKAFLLLTSLDWRPKHSTHLMEFTKMFLALHRAGQFFVIVDELPNLFVLLSERIPLAFLWGD